MGSRKIDSHEQFVPDGSLPREPHTWSCGENGKNAPYRGFDCEIEERGVRLRLTAVDTPGLGEAFNCSGCSETISPPFTAVQRSLQESGLCSQRVLDSRVRCRCCLIPPLGCGLQLLDGVFMKAMYKVNIVTVIGKADTLTLKEPERLKKRILDETERHNIKVYHLPDAESDEDEDFKEQTRLLKVRAPGAQDN